MRTKMAAACAALIGHCAMAQGTDVTLYGVVDLGLRPNTVWFMVKSLLL